MTQTYPREDPGCLTLSEDVMDARDFKAEEAIEVDWEVELPKSFSLGKRIRTTNYQNGWGSCTSNATAHGVQVLEVKKKGIVPTKDNIVTPDWKNLRTNMGHDLKNKNDSGDYVEKAVSIAYKNGISNIEGGISKYDGYCYGQRAETNKGIETIKRYLFTGKPVVWCMRGNKTTWIELTNGQLKTYIKPEDRTGGHAICVVGWDEGGLWFVNSRNTNDGIGQKSRFYVTYDFLKKAGGMFNWRYRILYNKEEAKTDPAYLKRKNIAVAVLKALRTIYQEETPAVQRQIESLSTILRNHYSEINDELPL